MTSAAEKYGKIPESLPADVHKHVVDSGHALKQSQVYDVANVQEPSKPLPTPMPPPSDIDVKEKGLSL